MQFDTRKSVAQLHGGGVIEQDILPDQTIQLTLYSGSRRVRQFQSIPVNAQTPASSPGGVIDLDGSYDGADMRYVLRKKIAAHGITTVVGASTEEQDQQRRGYENFVGSVLGVLGSLRRDETDRVRDVDYYANGELEASDALSFSIGMRGSQIRFSRADHSAVARVRTTAVESSTGRPLRPLGLR